MKSDAELFAERIYFTPEERKAFLRGVEWASPKSEHEQLNDLINDYKKNYHVFRVYGQNMVLI
jgi:hypothetical protein